MSGTSIIAQIFVPLRHCALQPPHSISIICRNKSFETYHSQDTGRPCRSSDHHNNDTGYMMLSARYHGQLYRRTGGEHGVGNSDHKTV